MDLEKGFVRAMNNVIGSKEAFLDKLYQDIYRGLSQ